MYVSWQTSAASVKGLSQLLQHIHICTQVQTSVHAHVCTCRQACDCVHACTHTCNMMHGQIHVHMHTYTHACTHIHMHAHTHIHMHAHSHMHPHMSPHIHVHMLACTHTGMPTHAHTHTHTHTHTHRCCHPLHPPSPTYTQIYSLFISLYQCTENQHSTCLIVVSSASVQRREEKKTVSGMLCHMTGAMNCLLCFLPQAILREGRDVKGIGAFQFTKGQWLKYEVLVSSECCVKRKSPVSLGFQPG